MKNGIPKTKENEVVENSLEDKEIRKKAQVLWAKSEGGKYFLESCDEIPSNEVCGDCIRRFKCNFSKSKEY